MQDRCTDHRLHRTFPRLSSILQGGEALHEIVVDCQQMNMKERFKEMLENTNEIS